MAFYLALYEGTGLHNLELVEVSNDQGLTRDFAHRMLERRSTPNLDTASGAIHEGRRRALEVVADESERGAEQ